MRARHLLVFVLMGSTFLLSGCWGEVGVENMIITHQEVMKHKGHPPLSENIYTALDTLFTTGGVTYADTLLHLNALDNSNERQLASNNAGKNYNIWTPGDPAHTLNEGKTDWIEGINENTNATGLLDQWGCSYPYTRKTDEQIFIL